MSGAGLKLHRRGMIGGALGFLAAGLGPIARGRGEGSTSVANATVALRSAIADATRAGRPYALPAGTIHASNLHLPDGERLIGVPGSTRLVLADEGPLRSADSSGPSSASTSRVDPGTRRPL